MKLYIEFIMIILNNKPQNPNAKHCATIGESVNRQNSFRK